MLVGALDIEIGADALAVARLDHVAWVEPLSNQTSRMSFCGS